MTIQTRIRNPDGISLPAAPWQSTQRPQRAPHRPIFEKSHIGMQRILIALCDAGTWATAKDVSAASGNNIAYVHRTLRRMQDGGLVDRKNIHAKRAHYRATEKGRAEADHWRKEAQQ